MLLLLAVAWSADAAEFRGLESFADLDQVGSLFQRFGNTIGTLCRDVAIAFVTEPDEGSPR